MKKQFMQWLLSKDELISSNAEYITARLDENLKSSHAENETEQHEKKMQ